MRRRGTSLVSAVALQQYDGAGNPVPNGQAIRKQAQLSGKEDK